jgi:uncharacterized protein (TIGR00369 family)
MTQLKEFSRFAEYAGESPDYQKICEIADAMVPFGNFVGVRITEASPERGVVEVPARDDLTNHMGTVHAGAMFLAADIAGAAAFVGALAPRIAGAERFALRDARITFLKPGAGRIRAIATVDERTVRRVLADPSAQRVDLDGKVNLYDDADVLVAKVYLDFVFHLPEA